MNEDIYNYNNEVDYTLIQLLFNFVREGCLPEIQNHIEKYNLDIRNIKDTHLEQNCLFFATLIKEDKA